MADGMGPHQNKTLLNAAVLKLKSSRYTLLRWVGALSRPPLIDNEGRIDSWLDNQVTMLVGRYTSIDSLIAHPSASATLRRWYWDLAEHDTQRTADDNPDRRVLKAALRQIVQAELRETLVIRLQIERQSLWDAYDRLQSEAELRFSIFWPLTLLTIVASVLWSPWFILALVAPLLLLGQGFSLRRQADDRVVQALTTGVIESPTTAALLA